MRERSVDGRVLLLLRCLVNGMRRGVLRRGERIRRAFGGFSTWSVEEARRLSVDVSVLQRLTSCDVYVLIRKSVLGGERELLRICKLRIVERIRREKMGVVGVVLVDFGGRMRGAPVGRGSAFRSDRIRWIRITSSFRLFVRSTSLVLLLLLVIVLSSVVARRRNRRIPHCTRLLLRLHRVRRRNVSCIDQLLAAQG